MAHATYDPGSPYGPGPQQAKLRGWVLGVPLALGLAWAGYTFVLRDSKTSDVPVEATTGAWRPAWQPAVYTPEPAGPPPTKAPDRTEAMLKELMAQQDALRKELEAMRKQPRQQVQTTAPAAAAAPPPQKKVRTHTPMVFIEHPPEKKAPKAEGLHWLGAGTWIPCTVEVRLNSDVPGYFTVKTRAPVYDTKTGQHLLIQQNQSIVAKDEAAALLFGNTRIPTFALTLSNPDGSSVDLGEMPITDQLGTNGLTGKVNNKFWQLVWSSIFIGGLRGSQQAIQAGIAPGNPIGTVTTGVTGQFSNAAQQRLGRAQDLRPEITVESGALCNILLTKALQLPAVNQSARFP